MVCNETKRTHIHGHFTFIDSLLNWLKCLLITVKWWQDIAILQGHPLKSSWEWKRSTKFALFPETRWRSSEVREAESSRLELNLLGETAFGSFLFALKRIFSSSSSSCSASEFSCPISRFVLLDWCEAGQRSKRLEIFMTSQKKKRNWRLLSLFFCIQSKKDTITLFAFYSQIFA